MSEHTATQQQARNETSHSIDIALDLLDLQILAILRDEPLWKKQVANQITDWDSTTINRRIDQLHDNDLVQSRIVPGGPDDPRDLYIAFKTTEKGRTALHTYRVCTDPDCKELNGPAEHVHDYVTADEYF